ncbi:MAG: hypothetical protein ABJZ55_23715 [Fuerstiella sp.]
MTDEIIRNNNVTAKPAPSARVRMVSGLSCIQQPDMTTKQHASMPIAPGPPELLRLSFFLAAMLFLNVYSVVVSDSFCLV